MESLLRMNWQNVWEDAELQTVCHYLRGSRFLNLPEEVKQILPKAI